MTVIVVDDERTFATGLTESDDIIYFRNVDDAILYLAKHIAAYTLHYADKVEQLWLDHDLGEHGGDIMELVEFMELTPVAVTQVLVHSQNPSGADRIVSKLKNRYKAKRVALPNLE